MAMDEAGRRLSRYFLTQLGINASFGIIIGIGLFYIGVPNPVLWAILSALLRFVPYIGSFISAALPIALAAAVDPGWMMTIWTAALYVVVEVLVSQAVEPVLYGHSTGLSPFAVVVSAIFWSWLWGPIGLILSMPLTLCLVVLGRHVERLAFLDVMLGDRPALTPIEMFYNASSPETLMRLKTTRSCFSKNARFPPITMMWRLKACNSPRKTPSVACSSGNSSSV